MADVDKLPDDVKTYIEKLSEWEGLGHPKDMKDARETGMIVSLNHSIYFHEPTKIRADEWLATEMDSPWAGDGRYVAVLSRHACKASYGSSEARKH